MPDERSTSRSKRRSARVGGRIRASVAIGLSLLGPVAAAGAAWAQASCPIKTPTIDDAKPNKLILYFPAQDDDTFPSCTFGKSDCYFPYSETGIKPLKKFSVDDLTTFKGKGTAEELRNAIRDVVVADYCELNVQVSTTTTRPTSTAARRVVVGIGTDDPLTGTFGIARSVDRGDAASVEDARIFAGRYNASTALTGAQSTLARWATAIAGTVAHEAGHTYGLAHDDDFNDRSGTSGSRPGEDDVTRHIMAGGKHYTDEQRAGFRRHFSDVTTSILAANLGLSVDTIHNWDFTNPNDKNAAQLEIDVLSQQQALTISWAFAGGLSPWVEPTVTKAQDMVTFKGINYNRFVVRFSKGKAWDNGPAGLVPGGAKFHVGVAFSNVDLGQPDAVIVKSVKLVNELGNLLNLQPRMLGYDAGAVDAKTGTMAVRFLNTDDPARALQLTDVETQLLPRVATIDSMLEGELPTGLDGGAIAPWTSFRDADCGGVIIPPSDTTISTGGRGVCPVADASRQVPLAALASGRNVVRIDDGRCAGGADSDHDPDDVNACPSKGISLDLFPSTTVLVSARVIDPAAEHFDPVENKFVVGPVESRVFFQVAGHRPDLNRNKKDDFIDIHTGTSKDTNKDGVPDEVTACLDPLKDVDACDATLRNIAIEKADLDRQLRKPGLPKKQKDKIKKRQQELKKIEDKTKKRCKQERKELDVCLKKHCTQLALAEVDGDELEAAPVEPVGGGADPDAVVEQLGGCSISSGRAGGGSLALLMAAALTLIVRRRRGRR